MRLKSISIEGFRGFVEPVTVSLDAQVILLHGPNGAGKTSLLDAILWALVGRMDRFGDGGSPVSVYARDGTARVELTLSDGNEAEATITRFSDGKDKNLVRLATANEVLDGPSAEARLIELVLPHLQERANPTEPLARVLTRGVYLQQDLIREFIESDSAAQRFSLISEVIGAGVVVELQAELERSKNLWSRSITNRRRDELEPLTERKTRLLETLRRLETAEEGAGADDVAAMSESFFADTVNLLGHARISAEQAPTDTARLDRVLKEIAAERAQLDRNLTVASALLNQLQLLRSAQPNEEPLSVDDLESQEKRLEADLAVADESIQQRLHELENFRKQQTEIRDHQSRLAALAELALTEIDGPCPVCTQEHNEEHTRRHLEQLIEAASAAPSAGAPPPTDSSDLQEARGLVARGLADVRATLARVRRQSEEQETSRRILRQRLTDIGLADDELAEEALRQRIIQLQERSAATDNLTATGEALSLTIIRMSERRQKADIQNQLDELGARIAALQTEIEAQNETHALATTMVEGLRDASLQVTAKQVKQIEPILQRIYSRVDPHPTFRVTQIVTAMERGKGRLTAGVYDPTVGKKMLEPGPILSSSQLNSFAVSLFLAMNLGLPSLKLGLTILDDPLQSLDSINLLGLVDVLRRFRAHRQIIMSTHEPQLLGLLQRKLRPVREGERVATIRFDSWSRRGPELNESFTEYEPSLNPQVVAA